MMRNLPNQLMIFVLAGTIIFLAGAGCIQVPQAECADSLDCQDRPHAECTGDWSCVEGYCVYECELSSPLETPTVIPPQAQVPETPQTPRPTPPATETPEEPETPPASDDTLLFSELELDAQTETNIADTLTRTFFAVNPPFKMMAPGEGAAFALGVKNLQPKMADYKFEVTFYQAQNDRGNKITDDPATVDGWFEEMVFEGIEVDPQTTHIIPLRVILPDDVEPGNYIFMIKGYKYEAYYKPEFSSIELTLKIK
ncbi:hypothetical protein JXB02_00575 [Candidatus Woesearchaeota archaeon]|nr:hypothetical protein [Candidatus Woesearchaeota archaeon]